MPKKLTKEQVEENKTTLSSIIRALKAGGAEFNYNDLRKILARSLAIIKQLERPRRDYS
jgi:hypothetical protein